MLLVAAADPGSAARAQDARPIDQRHALETRRMLYREPDLLDVEVQVLMGVLYLRGSVPDEEALKRAQALARRVDGLAEVRNRLRLREVRRASRSDSELERAVRELLVESGGGQVEITVHEGLVTLRGQLADVATADRLVESLRTLEGVRALDLDGISF